MSQLEEQKKKKCPLLRRSPTCAAFLTAQAEFALLRGDGGGAGGGGGMRKNQLLSRWIPTSDLSSSSSSSSKSAEAESEEEEGYYNSVVAEKDHGERPKEEEEEKKKNRMNRKKRWNASVEDWLDRAECAISDEVLRESSPLTWWSMIRDITIERCQLEGRRRRFEESIHEANRALRSCREIRKILLLLLPPSTRGEFRTERNELAESIANGFKGFSLMKLGRYAAAIPVLELAVTAMKERQHFRTEGGEEEEDEEETEGMHRNLVDASQKGRRRRRTMIVAENALRECYGHVASMMKNGCGKEEGCRPPTGELTKFPRTPHLFDVGSSTEDDIVLDETKTSSLLDRFCDGRTPIVMEEKIDGANVGLSLCPVTGQIYAQNRSHYISTGDHAQFGRLAEWIAENRSGLLRVLQDTDGRGERILYGEWMCARHSIPYHKLPGFFIAFDLYFPRRTKSHHHHHHHRGGRFASRRQFHSIMNGTGIPVVPIVDIRTFGPYPAVRKTSKQFQNELMVVLDHHPSAFRSDGGKIEGIVLRRDDDDDGGGDWLADRVKLVRSDFIAGCSADGHWFHRDIEKQSVDYEFRDQYLNTCYPLKDATQNDDRCHDHDDDDGDDGRGGAAAAAVPPLKKIPSTHQAETKGEVAAAAAAAAAVTVAVSGRKKKKDEEEKKGRNGQSSWNRMRRKRVPHAIMLMGLPGSGKSTFAERLIADKNADSDAGADADVDATTIPNGSGSGNGGTVRNNTNTRCGTVMRHGGGIAERWIHVNQDLLGRKECVRLASGVKKNRHGSSSTRVILDRCFPTESERREWLEIIHSPPKGDVALVYFDASAETCIERVKARRGHATIPEGKGEGIVRRVNQGFEPPTDDEIRHVFGTYRIVSTFEDSEALLREWGGGGGGGGAPGGK